MSCQRYLNEFLCAIYTKHMHICLFRFNAFFGRSFSFFSSYFHSSIHSYMCVHFRFAFPFFFGCLSDVDNGNDDDRNISNGTGVGVTNLWKKNGINGNTRHMFTSKWIFIWYSANFYHFIFSRPPWNFHKNTQNQSTNVRKLRNISIYIKYHIRVRAADE